MIKIIERSTIETIPLEFDFDQSQKSKENFGEIEKSDDAIDFNARQTNFFPYVYIDGVIIEQTNIIKLNLNNDFLIPYIEMSFYDPTNKLIDENYPLDDSIISVFKGSETDDFMPIKMDFKITDFNTSKKIDSNTIIFSLKAVPNVDDLYLADFEAFKGTSYDILKTISKDCKLGFATNIEGTNDEMKWINPSEYRVDFMKDVILHSYLSDETFLYGYVDYYYNFNYVDLEKQMQDDISEQMNIMDNKYITKENVEKVETPLILTNNPDQNNTNMYISGYNIENSTTFINLEYGYKHFCYFYDKKDFNINSYQIDSISDEGVDNKIILKGNPNSDINNSLYTRLIQNTWMGKIDPDNCHKNYLHSELQNMNNLKFLQKIKMVIRMPIPNYGLYRFQKVLVELFNLTKMDKKDDTVKVDNLTTNNQWDNLIIHRLSGEWLITAINYVFSNNNNYQEITLIKRELTDKYTFPRKQKNN